MVTPSVGTSSFLDEAKRTLSRLQSVGLIVVEDASVPCVPAGLT